MTRDTSVDWAERSRVFQAACASAREQLLRACSDAPRAQVATLESCLAHASESAFARDHGLAYVRGVDAFRSAVPIRDYHGIEPWIERAVAGESKVLTNEDPLLWLKTSGTTGPEKRIPQTRHWRLRYRGPAIYAQWGTYFHYYPQMLEHARATLDMSWEPDTPTRFLGSIGFQSITHREYSLGDTDWTPPWLNEPWFRFGPDVRDYASRMRARITHCAAADLRAIVAVNPSSLLAFGTHVRRNSDELLRALAASGEHGRERARVLTRLASSAGELSPRDLWPKLDVLVCWKSAGAALYMDELRAMYPGCAIVPFATTGTEGVVTLPVDQHPTAGLLAVNQAFYEFVPFREGDAESVSPDSATLLAHELEVGRDYRLVMTQGNGLFRYDVGDYYRVLEYVGSVPRLEYIGRVGSVSSFTGEKLTERQISSSVRRALRAVQLPQSLFVCCPVWASPPYYHLLVESSLPVSSSRRIELEREVERQLSRANAEYEGKRESDRLGPVRVTVLRSGAFHRYWSERVEAGAAALQLKHKWLHTNADLLCHLHGYAHADAGDERFATSPCLDENARVS